jgi:hypothetical protein
VWFSNVKHNHPLGSHRQLLQVQQALHNTAWPCPIPFGSKATASGKPGQWVGIGFPPCSHKFSLGDRVHCFWKCKRGRLQKFSEKTAVNPIHLPSLWSQLDQPLLVALWKDLKQLTPLLGDVRVRRSTTNYSVYIYLYNYRIYYIFLIHFSLPCFWVSKGDPNQTEIGLGRSSSLTRPAGTGEVNIAEFVADFSEWLWTESMLCARNQSEINGLICSQTSCTFLWLVVRRDIPMTGSCALVVFQISVPHFPLFCWVKVKKPERRNMKVS